MSTSQMESTNEPMRTSSAANSKKIVIALIAILILLAIGVGAAVAINNQQKNKVASAPAISQNNVEDDQTEQNAVKNGVVSYPTDETDDDSDTGISDKLPANFPQDIPIMSEALVGLSVVDNKSADDMVVYFSAPKGTNVVDFYKTELPKQGWTITTSTATKLEVSKDNKKVTVNDLGSTQQRMSFTIVIETKK